MRDGIIYDCPNANCRTPIYTGKCSKACIEKHNKELGIKPKTNADRIRAMSDEELVKYFWDIGVWDSFEDGKFCDNNCNAEHNCDLCRLKWLQQPCEEDG